MLAFRRLGALNVTTREARVLTFKELLLTVVIYTSKNFKQVIGFVSERRTQCKLEYNSLELKKTV